MRTSQKWEPLLFPGVSRPQVRRAMRAYFPPFVKTSIEKIMRYCIFFAPCRARAGKDSRFRGSASRRCEETDAGRATGERLESEGSKTQPFRLLFAMTALGL